MKHLRCLSIAALSLNLTLLALPATAQRSIMNPAIVRRMGISAQNPSIPTGLPLRFNTGTSVPTGGTNPYGVATGDFNRDGKQDIVVVNQDQDNVAVLLGNGDGTFAAPVTYSLPAGVPMQVAVADFNGDGNPDIAVITGQMNGFTSNVFVLLGNGTGNFSTAIITASGVNGLTIHAADINGDGKQDVVIGGNGSAALLYGKGDGTFQNPVLLSSSSGALVDAAVGDVNGDGRPDIVCAISNPTAGIAVFLQNSNGSFSPEPPLLASGNNGSGIALGDFNQDGKLDAILASNGFPFGAANVFLGNGDGTFQAGAPQLTGEHPQSVALSDFNRDGILDVVYSDDDEPQQLYLGMFVSAGAGNGTFDYNFESHPTTGGTRGVAVADFNGDGWPDIVTVDSLGNSVTVFLNLIGVNAGPQQFVPIAPCRVFDSRTGVGGLLGLLNSYFVIGLGIAGNGSCGGTIPETAAAYSLNVTIIPSEPTSYVQIWPSGDPLTETSILNSPDGRTRANALVVAAGSEGRTDVWVHGSAYVVIDVNGYFIPASPSTLVFSPMSPCRVFDTRNANGPSGGPYLQGGVERDFPVVFSDCHIPSGAQAYSMNFTAVPYNGEDLGYLTVWGKGSPQPGVSTLNNPTATIVANGAIVQAGTGGEISVYASDDTQLVGDIDGYFTPMEPPGGLSLYTLQPCRAIDTRQQNLAFDGEIAVNIAASPCAPSSSALAYVTNATVVPDPTLNYLTLWPDGEGRPMVSTLNAVDGTITSNMAIVGTSNGSIDAYAAGLTDLILDLFGYFAP
jgi:hypothetical protein